MKSTKFWIGVIGIILLLSAAVLIFQYTQNKPGTKAELYQNGVLIKTVPLNVGTEFTVTTAAGGYNVVQVKDGAISVIEASCPDKICIHEGAISSSAKPIVCLPNKLVIKVPPSAQDISDAIAG